MGAQSGLKSVGGNSQIMMQANQLAPHSHWFVDSYFADGHEESYANHWQRNPALRHTIDRIS